VRALAVVALLVGCGRIAFDARDDAGLPQLQIDAPPDTTVGAPMLVFVSTPENVVAGGCVNPVMMVQAQTAAGIPITVSSNTLLDMRSTSATTTFHTDSLCSNTPLFQIMAGTSTASLYWSDTKSGMFTARAHSTGYTDGTQVNMVHSAAASVLVFETAAQTVTAGTCSAMITLKSRDMYGNLSSVATTQTLMLSSTSVTMAFFSDNMCATMLTAAQITAGMSGSTPFYFKDATVGAPTITVIDAGGTLPSVMQTETIN
jgi:hypothetical protein